MRLYIVIVTHTFTGVARSTEHYASSLSFSEIEKKTRRVRKIFFFLLQPMGGLFEAAPSDDGLLLLFVCFVRIVVLDV